MQQADPRNKDQGNTNNCSTDQTNHEEPSENTTLEHILDTGAFRQNSTTHALKQT